MINITIFTLYRFSLLFLIHKNTTVYIKNNHKHIHKSIKIMLIILKQKFIKWLFLFFENLSNLEFESSSNYFIFND